MRDISDKTAQGAPDAYGLDVSDVQLAAPTIGSTTGAVIVHVGGARWGLPRGVRIAPGRDKLYALGPSGRLHVLVGRGGAVRELVVGLDTAARIRREMFGANA